MNRHDNVNCGQNWAEAHLAFVFIVAVVIRELASMLSMLTVMLFAVATSFLAFMVAMVIFHRIFIFLVASFIPKFISKHSVSLSSSIPFSLNRHWWNRFVNGLNWISDIIKSSDRASKVSVGYPFTSHIFRILIDTYNLISIGVLLVEESICASSLSNFCSFVHSISVRELFSNLTDCDLIVFSANDEVVSFLDKVLTNSIPLILIKCWLEFLRIIIFRVLVHEVLDQIFDLIILHFVNVNAQVDFLAINHRVIVKDRSSIHVLGELI